VLQRVKQLEHAGLQFEAADGSFEMLVRRSSPIIALVRAARFHRDRRAASGGDMTAQAMIQPAVGDAVMHTRLKVLVR